MIKNLEKLAKNNTRRSALEIITAGLEAVDTGKAFRENVEFESGTLFVKDKSFSLDDAEDIFIVAVGKCAADSAVALEKILGDKIKDGIAVDVCSPPNLERIRFFRGTHPFPSDKNKKAADEIIDLLKKAGGKDFVVFVISGGGSTLLHSSPHLFPSEEKKMLEEIFRAGAGIEEINTIRKHISVARGGNLAKHAYPARGVSLIFSDVPSNNLQFIASGPTVKDKTTIEDAERILEKYNILKKCGMEGCGLLETPKDEKYFENLENILFISNEIALEAMKEKAEEIGLNPEIRNTGLDGEARKMGREIVNEIHALPPGTVLLYGGETTVTVKGKGRGGRNQELVLSGLSEIRNGELLVSIASDGHDNTEHAGALGDEITIKKAEEMGLDIKEYLENNDSYAFFKKTGDYIETGITGSNIADLIVAVRDSG